MIALGWALVALVITLRALAAFSLPLSGDEAYYWEWSRRLAFGYVDHPPAVAWTIAAFAFVGHQAGVVRLGFVLCGAIAALAVAGCANEISSDRRAGVVAALALTLAPLASIAFGSASPDGPYLMFWALALWLAARAFKAGGAWNWVLLGAAVGGVLLSRVLGLALVFGLVAYALEPGRRQVWRGGMPVMLATAFLICLPFLFWNATHEWITLTFALFHRHQERRTFSSFKVLLAQFVAYSPGIWLALMACAARPRNRLLAWTALPQFGLVMLLSLFETVEISWILGFFVSLCAMLGLQFVRLTARWRTIWASVALVPVAILLPLMFAFSFEPAATFRVLTRERGPQLRNNGPFEIMTYRMVARDAAQLAGERRAIVMTDGYGFSSVMDFEAAAAPVVIGYNWQGREARGWYSDARRPIRALFVDKEPLASRPDFQKHLQRACGRVVDGGARGYSYAETKPRKYYFTWCEDMLPYALSILRWEREPDA